MTNKQIQMEICKAMLNANKRTLIADISDGVVAVTVDGFIAYALVKDKCVFDTSKIARVGKNLKDLFEINDEDKILKATPYTIDYHGYIAKKLECENFNIYVKEDLYHKISNFNLYSYGKLKRILAIDDFGFPVAVVMPIRVSEPLNPTDE